MGKVIVMDTSTDTEHEFAAEHPRCIIHLDVDYFYAQVEEVRHPEFKGTPLGVQQKNIVVTSNYEARSYGIKKCMLVKEALRLCPTLTLIKGEDLTPYRKMSAKISDIVISFTPLVERLGLDENFIDVTSLINEYSSNSGNEHKCSQFEKRTTEGESESMLYQNSDVFKPVGKIYKDPEEDCPCGCHYRLGVASIIAQDIRNKIYNDLGLSCSAGIAHNKLLAKLSGSLNKPNNQTIVYPFCASALLTSLGPVTKIPSVGRRTGESLTANNILTVEDVRKTSLESLQVKIGRDLARKIKDYAEGIDDAPVKPSGRPQTIGLEDGFRKVSLVGEVESRLSALLRRLCESACEDGRIPLCMKLTVRKQDSLNKSNSAEKRESRQCSLPHNLVPSKKGPKAIQQYDHPKILALAMKLFHRVVDVSKPFHVTLLGLAFTKFQEERSCGKSSIASFLRKQVAVQSVLDISSEDGFSDISLDSPMSINQQDRSDFEDDEEIPTALNKPTGNKGDSTSCHRFICEANRATPSPIDIRERNSGEEDEDILSEIEPSPKKTKLEVWLSGRRESPSIEMADLRLTTPSSSPISKTLLQTNPTVLKSSIPVDIDKQISQNWTTNTTNKKLNDLFKYSIANK